MSSTTFDFSRWPPTLTDTQIESLTLHGTTYALFNGLTYLPPGTTQPPSPSSAIHAPISLLPSPVPRSLFVAVQQLQSAYNVLYSRIAMDDDFLDKVMGAVEGAGKVDDFTGTLWRGWKDIRDEGIVQPLHLGLFRSDYLLHTGEEDGKLSFKQVEFNTISSSFGALSERAASMHRYLQALTNYYGVSSHLKPENFPANDSTKGLAEGLAEAHNAYGVSSAYILFVVQQNERNVFDQRWLEYELLQRHGIRAIRQTFEELATSATIDSSTRALRITIPSTLSPSGSDSSIEISAVYLRAGYTPSDYPTPTHFATRFTLERSRAVKCPTIPLQLAGGKKVQEVLSRPGMVERFVGETNARELRRTWMRMWSLDDSNLPIPLTCSATPRSANEPNGTTLARALANSLVLKPQREGGGNNVYKNDIPLFLETLPLQEREAWIAMELIVPPRGVGSYLVRAGTTGNNRSDSNGGGKRNKIVRAETVSELGIYGWSLFSRETGVRERGDVGWLMRTKGVESNEGGLAAGFSVLDSVVLVDE
ncbi:hypothetical protein J3A83DRAFT_4084540 [Scleroderma citrinum]